MTDAFTRGGNGDIRSRMPWEDTETYRGKAAMRNTDGMIYLEQGA